MNLPYIPNALVARDQADGVATHWRQKGYNVRVVPRAMRALGAHVLVYAVVVVKEAAPEKPRCRGGGCSRPEGHQGPCKPSKMARDATRGYLGG